MKFFSALSTISLALVLAIQACASPRYKCADFKTPQQVIDAYQAGATYLDRDGNGYACEKTWNVYVLKDKKQKTTKRARPKQQAISSSVVTPLSASASAQAQLTMGNPSQAGTQPDNYLLLKPQYALSYNASKGIPNWVSWQLNQSWLGSVDRQNDFRPDDTLPSNFYHVTPTDYSGSGYDRGHQAPSGDRTRSQEDNSATFLMTNMIPQAPDLNRGPWEKLESYSRQLVSEGEELYIIAGVTGEKGTLAEGKISIPARNWKVVVVLEKPGLGLAGVTENTRVIAVDMPNEEGIKETDWTAYRTTVKQIEKATGYNLLSNVPDKVQQVIENKVDSP
ncbi:MAG: DNA/RNA non-specific endonuclease [Gloeobacterales cyanobacterium]